MSSRKPDLLPQKQYGQAASWAIHGREYLNFEATVAAQFAERWALVAGVPDGEDSAGRQKLRLPTPEELASRCADLSAALRLEFENRGWVLEVPSSADAAAAYEVLITEDKKNDRL